MSSDLDDLSGHDVKRLADAIERRNALNRIEIFLELQDRPEFPDSYDAIISNIEDMERDFL